MLIDILYHDQDTTIHVQVTCWLIYCTLIKMQQFMYKLHVDWHIVPWSRYNNSCKSYMLIDILYHDQDTTIHVQVTCWLIYCTLIKIQQFMYKLHVDWHTVPWSRYNNSCTSYMLIDILYLDQDATIHVQVTCWLTYCTIFKIKQFMYKLNVDWHNVPWSRYNNSWTSYMLIDILYHDQDTTTHVQVICWLTYCTIIKIKQFMCKLHVDWHTVPWSRYNNSCISYMLIDILYHDQDKTIHVQVTCWLTYCTLIKIPQLMYKLHADWHTVPWSRYNNSCISYMLIDILYHDQDTTTHVQVTCWLTYCTMIKIQQLMYKLNVDWHIVPWSKYNNSCTSYMLIDILYHDQDTTIHVQVTCWLTYCTMFKIQQFMYKLHVDWHTVPWSRYNNSCTSYMLIDILYHVQDTTTHVQVTCWLTYCTMFKIQQFMYKLHVDWHTVPWSRYNNSCTSYMLIDILYHDQDTTTHVQGTCWLTYCTMIKIQQFMYKLHVDWYTVPWSRYNNSCTSYMLIDILYHDQDTTIHVQVTCWLIYCTLIKMQQFMCKLHVDCCTLINILYLDQDTTTHV